MDHNLLSHFAELVCENVEERFLGNVRYTIDYQNDQITIFVEPFAFIQDKYLAIDLVNVSERIAFENWSYTDAARVIMAEAKKKILSNYFK